MRDVDNPGGTCDSVASGVGAVIMAPVALMFGDGEAVYDVFATEAQCNSHLKKDEKKLKELSSVIDKMATGDKCILGESRGLIRHINVDHFPMVSIKADLRLQ